ncbi:MAG: hypothetical protein KGI52_18120 [Burkholderiales bacterium]|nr:hypothetical protein [Burkholderiales bacterium]
MRTAAKVEGDNLYIVHSQDIGLALREAAEARAAESHFTKPKDFKKVCSVDRVVLMEIERKYGLSYLNPEHADRVLAIVRREYPKFLHTNKT